MNAVVESSPTERTTYIYLSFIGWHESELRPVVPCAKAFIAGTFCLTDADALVNMSYLSVPDLLAFAKERASQGTERQYSVAFFPKKKMIFLPSERDTLQDASFRWDVFGVLPFSRIFVPCESSEDLR